MLSNEVFTLAPIIDSKGFSGRAEITSRNGALEAKFKAGSDSYVLRYELSKK